jgi:hypothetical protein
MPNEISALNSELELRGLPGKLAQWRRQSQRFGRWLLVSTRLDPFPDEVVRMRFSPRLLFPFAAGSLAVWVFTSALTGSDSWIGTKPAAANTTRSLSGISHGDSASPDL